MSFFGFNPTKPPSQTHNTRAPGFGPTVDPFASLSGRNDDNNVGETLNFDDDGLGDALEETGDAFNDATFGTTDIGTDFDLSGGQPGFSHQSTARPQPQQQALGPFPFPTSSYEQASTRPTQTGYEKYKRPNDMRDFTPDANIWGLGPPQATGQAPRAPAPARPDSSTSKPARSMMTLDEVEAMLRQPKQPSPAPPAQIQEAVQNSPAPPTSRPTPAPHRAPAGQDMHDIRPTQAQDFPSFVQQYPSIPRQTQVGSRMQESPTPQNFNNQHANAHHRAQSGVSLAQLHHRGPSLNGQPVTNAEQITQLTEEEKTAFLREEANRAKRNHKIQMLARDNGLMTPQDKNFITRIQLSQLMTAIGSTEENSPEVAHTEDFYYQVYSQIYAAALESGVAPDAFTQMYLNQLSWRGGSRRYPRGGENHMRRMQQQVQRAVEAAKSRPKNKQLVMEGSLGKISFSNAKTPKPLLNIKRQDSHDATSAASNRPRPHDAVGGRKAVLRDIEKVYNALMRIEDCERNQPPQPREESSADEIQAFMDWRHKFTELNQTLWNNWKVHAPIDSDSTTPHPFMAMMSHPKGKKLVPRVFRQIDDQQRLTVLTIFVVQLDQLDVIRDVQPSPGKKELPLSIRHEADLFGQAVEPSLFAYIADASLSVITGLIGLIYQRVNIQMVMQSRAGINLLTRFLSRAVQLVQGTHANAQDSEQWNTTFNQFFDKAEPHLPSLFLSVLNPGEDFFVWQFLAASGILASPEQQQKLVLGVKDQVMGTVGHAKSLPEPQGQPNLDKVNLFMHAIGLDVDLLG